MRTAMGSGDGNGALRCACPCGCEEVVLSVSPRDTGLVCPACLAAARGRMEAFVASVLSSEMAAAREAAGRAAESRAA
jgi:hypothetical protein